MSQFFNRHKYKFIMIVFLVFLLFGLTGCRTNSAAWQNKVYIDGWSGYGKEFSFSGFGKVYGVGRFLFYLGQLRGFVPILEKD